MTFAGVPLLGLDEDFDEILTTQKWPLGTFVVADQGQMYEFIVASVAITAADFLRIDEAHASEPWALRPTTAVNQVVAGAALATFTAGQFGWAQCHGRLASGNVATATAANAQLGSSATAGQLSTITIATPTAAEVQRVLAAASGRGVLALDAEAANRAECFIF